MLELVEGRIEGLVNSNKLLFKSLQLALILKLRFFEGAQLILQLRQIRFPPLHVLLPLEQEYLLLLVMLLHGFGEGVLSVF